MTLASRRYLLIACCTSLLSACAYLSNVLTQSSYATIHEQNPSQHNLKHMINRQTYFVSGLLHDKNQSYRGTPLAIAAYCDRYQSNELVDVNFIARAGTHYGLNLPEGSYQLIVLADQNKDGVFTQSELVGQRDLALNAETWPNRVVGKVDFQLSEHKPGARIVAIDVPTMDASSESLFYPKGTLRSLSDTLFDVNMATLGMYEPAAFLEHAPTMFYALEEHSYKIPLIFVHGIGGSPREFELLLARIDRSRFQPWFFYYPSGTDLNQLAKFFYSIYLSGEVVQLGEMPMVIVAHSMGGLIIREALNLYQGIEQENNVSLLITLASPFGGHPAATAGVNSAPMVIPSWRDLDSNSEFIDKLFRKPLNASIDYHLYFAAGTQRSPSYGQHDGVVPVASQLNANARQEADTQLGFDVSHSGILKSEAVISRQLSLFENVQSVYPDTHLKILAQGGYDTELDDSYTDVEKFYIRSMGKYWSALAEGNLKTYGDEMLERFIKVAQGKITAQYDHERAWRKFVAR